MCELRTPVRGLSAEGLGTDSARSWNVLLGPETHLAGSGQRLYRSEGVYGSQLGTDPQTQAGGTGARNLTRGIAVLSISDTSDIDA